MSSPAIRLYGPALAPFTEKVRRALALKKLAYELVEPQGPEDYRRYNPETGLLPVADVDGRRVADSARILDALDERYPEPPLVSSDPRAAASQRRLEAWAGETFFFYWVNWAQALAEAPQPASAPRRAGRLARFGILRRVTERSRSVGGESGSDRLGAEFVRRVGDLQGFLGTRPFFYADRISRADLSVYAFLRVLLREDFPDGPAVLARYPGLVALMRRVEQETGAGPDPG